MTSSKHSPLLERTLCCTGKTAKCKYNSKGGLSHDLLTRWNKVDWSPTILLLIVLRRDIASDLLEEKDVWLWLMDLVMLPSKTLLWSVSAKERQAWICLPV